MQQRIILLLAALSPLAVWSQTAPEVSFIVDSVDQGSSFVIMGDRLDRATEVWLWQPGPDERGAIVGAVSSRAALPATPPPAARRTRILGPASEHALIAVQLGGEPAYDDNAVPTVAWVKSDAGFSKPYLFNQPKIVFLSDAEVLPGERLRIFGRNLWRAGARGMKYDFPVAFTNSSGQTWWGSVLEFEIQERLNIMPYQLQVAVPKDIPPGDYRLTAHALSGGTAAWSNAAAVKVVSRRDLAATMARLTDNPRVTARPGWLALPAVRKVTGLNGDGMRDDSRSIQREIDALSSEGGGIVVLPAGTFALEKTLRVRPNVVLQGAGRAATQLTSSAQQPLSGGFPFPVEQLFKAPWGCTAACWGPFLKEKTALVWMGDKAGLQDLSLIAGPGTNTGVIVAEPKAETIVRDSFIKRVEIINRQQNTYTAVETPGHVFGGVVLASATRGFTLSESRIVASNPFHMLYGRRPHEYARIHGNVFQSAPASQSNAVMLLNFADSIFEDNEIFDGYRGFTNQKGMSRNWIAGNRIHQISGVPNGSEILMSELGSWHVKGPLKKAAELEIVFAEDSLVKAGEVDGSGEQFYAYVLSGRGMGQYRRVTGNGRDSFTIDRPWTILPDASSQVAILRAAVENFFIGNRVDDTRGAMQFVYGAGFENVIAGNEAHNASGFNIWGQAEDQPKSRYGGNFAPVAFNLFQDNRLVNSGGMYFLGSPKGKRNWGDDRVYDYGTNFANIMRRNQVWSPSVPRAANQYWNIWWRQLRAGVREPETAFGIENGAYNIIESCFGRDNQLGVVIRNGKANVVRNNLFELIGKELTEIGDPQSFWEPVSKVIP